MGLRPEEWEALALSARVGITSTLVDITDLGAVEAAIGENTRAIYAESISNPTLRVADIPALAAIARRHGIKLVVDNTFSPLIIRPKTLGADIVVHSMTKFIGGAADHIAGVICADQEFILQLMDLHVGALMLLGPTMDPQVAFNLSLRIPHLALRSRHVRAVPPIQAFDVFRPLPHSGAHAIHRCIAAADHHDSLAIGIQQTGVKFGHVIAERLTI